MNRSRSARTAAGIAIAILAAVSAVPADAVTLTRYPSVWLQTTESIRIYWRTDLAASGKVLYGESPTLGLEATHSGSVVDHVVDLTGLSSGTFYYYRVVSDTDTLSDGSDQFRTAPSQAEPYFRFLAFGDLGRATAEQIQVAARIDTLGADLAILTGDIIYEGGEAVNFTPQYFDIYRPTIARTPFYPSLGNHDVVTLNGQPYLDAFHLPSAPSPAPPERYYSFDYGSVHFVALEVTVENAAPNAAMISWLAADLAATTMPWKVVFFHVPMYSNGGVHGGDATIAAALEGVFEANDVDVVFQGHNHFYTRTYPIASGAAVDETQDPTYLNPGGPIYITTGGAGRALHGIVAPSVLEAVSISAFHVTVVDVFGSTMLLSVVGLDGSTLDTMSLTKDTVTAVTLAELAADPSPGGVRLRWRGAEVGDIAGFHVYRGDRADDVSTRLTVEPLLPGLDNEYLDETAREGHTYWYSIGAVGWGGSEDRVGLVSGTRGGPYRFAAGKPRPNPSRGESEIPFTLDRESRVTVTIHDVAGRVVRVIDSPGPLGPGPGSLRWDGRDSRGRPTAAGLYFLTVRSGSRTAHERVIRLR